MLHSDDEQLSWMALAELGYSGTACWYRLAQQLGSAAAVFTASARTLGDAGLTARGVSACCGYRGWEQLVRKRDRCRVLGIEIALPSGRAYPSLLREVSDPPLVLYYRGCQPSALGDCIAIVGSRRATRYGVRTAERVARSVAAAGVTVVSGLAMGIDAAAHRGSLAGGRGAAVMAGGLDSIYPSRNRGLARRLLEKGSVISEYPPGVHARAFHFPIRNRIITGISRATIVVEATARSGSLVSARLAMEQGRELRVVPGNVDAPTSAGTNALLRDGCPPLLEADDILTELAIAVPAKPRSTVPDEQKTSIIKQLSDETAARVLAALDSEPRHVDDLAGACGLDEALVLEKLTALELDGLAQRLAGGTYALR